MLLETVTITNQRRIAKDIYEIKVNGQLVEKMTQPGQFVHIKIGNSLNHLLRRPISICDVDLSSKECTMIYRAEGAGTKQLAALNPGDSVSLLGPLGNGYSTNVVDTGQRALLVGGGVGVPPLYYLSKELVKQGIEVTHVLGFASAEDVFYEEEFKHLGKTYIATVDGTSGSKGFVTDVINDRSIHYDTIFACGPMPMLQALEKDYADQPLYLSLEQRMGCGIGACMACVCHVPFDESGTKYKKVCTDGPVFKAGEVVLT